jgi:hypothetical protein
LVGEANEMRRDRDNQKQERNEMFLQSQKELEDLKDKLRELQSENDRTIFK